MKNLTTYIHRQCGQLPAEPSQKLSIS